jgi:hypothetical protein
MEGIVDSSRNIVRVLTLNDAIPQANTLLDACTGPTAKEVVCEEVPFPAFDDSEPARVLSSLQDLQQRTTIVLDQEGVRQRERDEAQSANKSLFETLRMEHVNATEARQHVLEERVRARMESDEALYKSMVKKQTL